MHPLEMVLEECPLSKYTPQEDKYRPIEFEDEIIGEQDANSDSSDEDLEKEQHCELLIVAVNGEPNQEKAASVTFLSIKSPSPRLTRSRAARNRSINVPQKHNLNPSFQLLVQSFGIQEASEPLELLKGLEF